MTTEPPKPIRRTRPRAESDADRQVLAQITEADIVAAKAIVGAMSKSGTYTEDGKIRRIAGRVARKYWGVG